MLEVLSLSMLVSPLSLDFTLVLAMVITVISYLRRYRHTDTLILSTILLFLSKLGMSIVVSTASIFILLGHRFVKNTLQSIAVYLSLSIVYLSYLNLFLHWDWNYMILLSLISTLSASLMESIRSRPFLILLGVSTSLSVFHVYALSVPVWQILLAFAISFVLSLIALKAGIADESGLMSATLIGVIIIVYTDLRFFLLILTFYILGSAVTKFRYDVKLRRGIAEQSGGARGFANVFSNSLPALFFAMNYGVFKMNVFALAFTSSIATALGDTMASEIGKTSNRVYMITNFKRVKPGESGGISIEGELSALVGCLIVSLMAYALKIVDLNSAFWVALIGFLGVHIDSLLGATLEKKGMLNNAGVNFMATLLSGLLALVVGYTYCNCR